jgi:hypothetical protein
LNFDYFHLLKPLKSFYFWWFHLFKTFLNNFAFWWFHLFKTFLNFDYNHDYKQFKHHTFWWFYLFKQFKHYTVWRSNLFWKLLTFNIVYLFFLTLTFLWTLGFRKHC